MSYLHAVQSAAKAVDRHTQEHCCSSCCQQDQRPYAMGQPPSGWRRMAADLAQRHGYTLHRDRVAYKVDPSGHTEGFTVGRARNFQMRRELNELGISANSVHYIPQETEAGEFSVAVHELGHVVLRHPEEREADEFGNEIPVRLAAVAVCYEAGLANTKKNVCQMTRRIMSLGQGRPVTLEHQHAALQAAQVIGAGLARKLVAA